MEFTEQEKKVLADKYETFKEEIELAMIQNCIVECELYSLLAEIIRGTKSGEKISLRDVSVRRKTKLSMWLHGAAGFPDFVVLERKKSRDAVVSCELYRVIFAGGHIYSLCSLPAGDHGSERHYHCIDHAPRTGCGDHECGV